MPETTQPTTLSELEKVRAATNDPMMSDNIVKLGGREFVIVDLTYDNYCKFLAYLQPLMDTVAGRVAGLAVDKSFTSSALIKYCVGSLPEMARIALHSADPTLTTEGVKELAGSPFALAAVVTAQIKQNNMISEIVDFFKQMLPLLKLNVAAVASTPKATP